MGIHLPQFYWLSFVHWLQIRHVLKHVFMLCTYVHAPVFCLRNGWRMSHTKAISCNPITFRHVVAQPRNCIVFTRLGVCTRIRRYTIHYTSKTARGVYCCMYCAKAWLVLTFAVKRIIVTRGWFAICLKLRSTVSSARYCRC